MITEVYISLDGARYYKLDIEESDAINMRYIAKDLQDISKVFSPFSKDFSFKATPTNQRVLNFFGDTSIIRPQTENKYLCKVYTNGILNLTGILQIKTGRYKNQKLETYNASFGTFMTNLKDRVGNDTLNDLGSAIIDYRASDIKTMMQSGSTFTDAEIDVKYFIPFMSNNRVWTFDENVDADIKDNIYYRSDSEVGSDKYINETELRPAISLTSIIEYIKRKYSLDIVAPIESRAEAKDAYILCNSSKFTNVQWWTYRKPNNSIPIFTGGLIGVDEWTDAGSPSKYILTSNNANSSFRITKNTLSPTTNSWFRDFCSFYFSIDLITSGVEYSGRFRIRHLTTNEILYYEEFTTADNGRKTFKMIVPESSLTTPMDFVVEFSFDQYVRFDKVNISLLQYVQGPGFVGSLQYKAPEYNYPSGVGGLSTYNKFKVDLIAALPSTSILDFIQSYLKTFNIKIYDTSPSDNRLFWLAPVDINTIGLTYSKAIVDYTPYLESTEYTKEAVSQFNYYNFKHATSKYRSNVDYKTAAGLEYGQASYPVVPPNNINEYKIETNWSIIPAVFVDNSTRLLTAYGFTSEVPEFTSTQHFRYTPNFDELTLFYKSNTQPIAISAEVFGVGTETDWAAIVNCDSNGVPSIAKLSNCYPPLPVNSSNNSLAFSVIVVKNVEYEDSLYARGYSFEIERLTDQNVLVHNFVFNLPSDEIYLNEWTHVQGTGRTPTGFRLQNDIIVGENRFSIADATIDITTGKLTGKFLNYR